MDVATSLPAMCRAFLPFSVRCGHQPWNWMVESSTRGQPGSGESISLSFLEEGSRV